MEKKRKRAAHRSACESCYRAHRPCDGNRPCERCLSLNKEDTCRTAISKKERRDMLQLQASLLLDMRDLSSSSFFTITSPTPLPQHPPPQHQQQPHPSSLPPVLGTVLEGLRDLKKMAGDLKHSHGLLRHELSTLRKLDSITSDSNYAELIDEADDMTQFSHDSRLSLVPAARTVSKDRQRFNQSAFIPFAIEDATQVYYFKNKKKIVLY